MVRTLNRVAIISAALSLLFTLAAALPAAAQYDSGVVKTGPSVVGTPSTSASYDEPGKIVIKLDLQVEQDSSIYTKTIMVQLEKLNAAEVEPFVKKSLSTYGSVSINSQQNMLIITDREPKLSDLVRFIKDMEKLGMENFVQLETEVIHINNTKASNIVSVLSRRLSSDGTIQADDNLNVLVVTDVRGKIDYIKDIIYQIDVPPQQVVIEARIVQLYDTDLSDVGIDLPSLLNQGIISFFTEKQSVKDWGAGMVPSTQSQRSKDTRLSAANYANQVVNMIVGSGKAKLIASPRIVTLNNKTGSVRIESSYYFSPTDSSPFVMPVMELTATPNIGADGLITIDFRAAAGMNITRGATAGNDQLPGSINTRSVESTIQVHKGDTFVVGGLDFIYQTKGKRKTPLISEIPLIGDIFTEKVNYMNNSQILFFITPTVIENQSSPPTKEEEQVLEEDNQ